MGAVNIDNTGSGASVTLSSDGTDLLLNGSPIGGSGDVVGPASSTDNAVARFDSTTGKLLQNSAVTIGDDGTILAPSVGSVIPFYFSDQASFPSAATYHGAIVHSHADGKMYFAHSGVWNALANAGDIVADTDTTYSISAEDGTTGKKIIRLTAGGSGSGTDDVVLVAGSNVTLTRAGDEITISSAGAAGTSALDDLTDVNAPSPTDGQALVWNASASEWQAQTVSGGGGITTGKAIAMAIVFG
jgi:hypothetical protein